MAGEPKDDREEIDSILSDLDAILSDMGAADQAELAPIAPADSPKAPEIPIDSPKVNQPLANPVLKIEIPSSEPEPVKIEAPQTIAPMESPKVSQLNIELAPRDGIIKPPEKKTEPPKPAPKLPDHKPIEFSAGPMMPELPPAPNPSPIDPLKTLHEPVKPAETPAPSLSSPAAPMKSVETKVPMVPPPKVAPEPAAVPVPIPVMPSAEAEGIPADAPREQIRRVAFIYTSSCSESKSAFAAFLVQAARTISKKPLFLREVLSHEVSAASDTNAVLQKALQAKAAAILAVVEDWPSSKADELSDACARANMLFRAVASGDAQKKSTAVDIIVDMMLLAGEG